jgi:hypothetical protein
MTPESSPPQSDPDSLPTLSLDTVLELLANQRRRFALYSLLDGEDDLIGFETLVEDVATLEAAHANEALTRDHVQDVAADLYHWHLPVLADVGIIDCDARHDLIRWWSHPLLTTWTARVRQDELQS